MARFIKAHRSNPEIFGEDVMALAFQGLGIGVAGLGNDKVVAPFVKGLVPAGNDTVSKLVDAVTTGATAFLVGEGVGMVDRKIGNDMKEGGMILAVARGITAFIPGYQLSETIPFSLGAGSTPPKPGSTNGLANPTAPALPAAGGTSGSAPVNPSYVMNDYPRGVSPSQDVGL